MRIVGLMSGTSLDGVDAALVDVEGSGTEDVAVRVIHSLTLPYAEERRRAIADIARRYGVWIVEDNLYGAMTRDAIPLIAEFAPDLTFVVGGLSKSVSAGVRGGWVHGAKIRGTAALRSLVTSV